MDNFLANIGRNDIKIISILIIVTGFLYFFALGDMALTDPDETFYAQTAKEMFLQDEWITPTIFGEPQFEKPIFFYWTVILGYKFFGISEFSARFSSALFGILGILGVYFLGKFLFSRLCGFFSGLVLATSMQYFVLSRACVTDMALMVFILYCLLFLLLGLEREQKKYYIYASIMAGLAVLTKGPIGLMIPGAVYIIYIAITRQWSKIRKVPFVSSIAIFLLVAAPWYIAVTKIHGASFLNEFFGFQNITRFLEAEHEIGSSPFFYIPAILAGLFPWSLFLPLGFVDIIKSKDSGNIRKYGKLLITWFFMVFLFFSFSQTKLVTYIFPLYPAMAILVGRVWERFILSGFNGEEKPLKFMKVSYYTFFALCMGAVVGLLILVHVKYPRAFYGTAITLTIFISGLFVSGIAFVKDNKFFSFSAMIITVMVVLIPLDIFVLPEIEKYESRKEMSLTIKKLAGPQEAIGGESDNRRGIAYYTDNIHIEDIGNYNRMRDFFMRKKRVWGIIKRKHYDNLVGTEGEIVSKPIVDSGKWVLVNNKN